MTTARPRSLDLADRRRQPELPCFVIAEAGVNHDGEPDLAHRLVDLAADAGADAVKFQIFRPEDLVAADAGAAPYQAARGAAGQRALLESLLLPEACWPEIAAHAAERGLTFLATAFDAASLDLLLELEVPALKVPSGEIDHLPFLARIARQGLPLVVSTGLASEEEVAVAVDTLAPAPRLYLLHCVTAYPAPVASSNLRAMVRLGERFGVPVGWSDHTQGLVTAVAAVALGATLLEKHVTVDRSRPGPDHAASADATGFAEYVAAVRAAEASLGDGVKQPRREEEENRFFVRRSYHAAHDLEAGRLLVKDDLRLLRPARGLPAGARVAGRRLLRPLAAGEPIRETDLAEPESDP